MNLPQSEGYYRWRHNSWVVWETVWVAKSRGQLRFRHLATNERKTVWHSLELGEWGDPLPACEDHK